MLYQLMEKFNIVKIRRKLLFYPSSLQTESKGSAPGRWEVEEQEGVLGLAVRLQSGSSSGCTRRSGRKGEDKQYQSSLRVG